MRLETSGLDASRWRVTYREYLDRCPAPLAADDAPLGPVFWG